MSECTFCNVRQVKEGELFNFAEEKLISEDANLEIRTKGIGRSLKIGDINLDIFGCIKKDEKNNENFELSVYINEYDNNGALNDDDMLLYSDYDFRYCPMCGRKLNTKGTANEAKS